jgi:hypothetical protein
LRQKHPQPELMSPHRSDRPRLAVLCCCTTAAQAIYLQQDLLLTFHNLIKLILAFLNLAAERVNIVLVIGKLLLELG